MWEEQMLRRGGGPMMLVEVSIKIELDWYKLAWLSMARINDGMSVLEE